MHFSVCEPMALESLGFSEKGKGVDMVKELHETNNFKINPRGGLIGSGHPLGATGIAQTIENYTTNFNQMQVTDKRIILMQD